MAQIPLDDVDRQILYELQRDARQPVDQIAHTAKVPEETVRERIEVLENHGVIDGYHAKVNYDEADVQHYYMFQCSARISQREQLAEQVLDELGVLEVYTLMTGRNNFLVVGAGGEKDDMTGLAYDIDSTGIDIEREALIKAHTTQPFEAFRL